MEAGKDKLYCGEHGFMEKGSRRIVCPLDPKHTVCEDKLHTHMLKCNAKEKPKPVYYVENINAGLFLTLFMFILLISMLLLLFILLLFTGLCLDVDEHVLSHSVLHQELKNPKNGDSAHKHLRQQVSSQWAHSVMW
uniref:tRNA:m(4)X modification enzyme TRM13 n=1 Tax=Gouania willdenowi TaxID=441366 RepID=A0A8C5D505_GOUWI